jgi:hypothetical protein
MSLDLLFKMSATEHWWCRVEYVFYVLVYLDEMLLKGQISTPLWLLLSLSLSKCRTLLYIRNFPSNKEIKKRRGNPSSTPLAKWITA